MSDKSAGPGQCSVSGSIGALAVFICLLIKGIFNIISTKPLHKAVHSHGELSAQHEMSSSLQES